MSFVRTLVSTLIVSLALAPTVAFAGNDDGVLLGNEAAMSGGAVAAVTRDGSAAWYNPAGLADAERNVVDVNGNAFMIRAANESDLISSTSGETNDGGYLELISIPAAATVTRRLEPGIHLALGVFAPRFSSNSVRTGLDAGSDAASARWTLSSTEFRATYHADGAVGFRVSDQLRLGISLFGVYRERNDTFQTAGAFALDGVATRILARGGVTQLRSFGLELGIGVQWEPQPGMIIGFTARSPGLEILTQVRRTTTVVDASVSDVDPDTVFFAPEDVEELAPGAAVLTPGRFNLAFGYRFSSGWLAIELDVQPPLDIDTTIADRQLVWNLRVGGRLNVDERVGLGAGLFTDLSDGSPIRDLGETRVDFYGVTAGLEYRTPHDLGDNEPADTLVFSTTFAIRYAVGFGEVAGLRFDPSRSSQMDTVAVDTTIHEIGFHLGSALYF